MNLPTEAFSNKSGYYAEYRPSYSDALLGLIVERCGLKPDSVVADLGSGTGTLASLFLGFGNSVFAIEPNADMRKKAEELLGKYAGFESVDATAEATTLPTASVDLVTAGRAMQWFDVAAALQEISRILRPGGWAVAVWNELQPGALVSAYRDILHTYSSSYDMMAGKRQAARDLLIERGFTLENLANEREMTWRQLKGLVLSLSACPDQGSPQYAPMMRSIEALFATHAVNGRVNFDYNTMVYSRRAPF